MDAFVFLPLGGVGATAVFVSSIAALGSDRAALVADFVVLFATVALTGAGDALFTFVGFAAATFFGYFFAVDYEAAGGYSWLFLVDLLRLFSSAGCFCFVGEAALGFDPADCRDFARVGICFSCSAFPVLLELLIR